MILDYQFDWSRIFESFIVSFIAGILVSVIFLFALLKFMRPKFDISEFICRNNEVKDGANIPKYTFKIVNKSIFHAFDAKIELFLMMPVTHTGSMVNLKFNRLAVRTSNMNHIKRYRKKYHRVDPSALFAIHVHTNENIHEMLENENSYIELKITVRHGLTGLADTFTQQFGNTGVIKSQHKFEFAKLLGTIPNQQTV